MANTDFKNVDEYLASFPEGEREVLVAVRAAIREGAPEAAEVISYQMPAYKLHGLLIYFAGFKHHFSLFCPQPEALLEAFKDELAPFHVSKSTIQFPLDQPVPVELITAITRHRVAEYTARAEAKRRSKS